jgi:hypothetical protein
MQAASADGRRRALGDLKLEARQLADAERQIAAESNRARQNQSDGGKDTLRRLAGEQERLAERLGRVQSGLKQQESSAPSRDAKSASDLNDLRQAASAAARELDRQRLGEKMQQSADAMRADAGRADPKASNGRETPSRSAAGSPQSQEEIARALDRVADSIAAADRPADDESRKLSNQLARAQEMRERLDDLTRRLEQLDQPADSQNGARSGGRSGQPKDSQPSGSQQSTAGESGKSGQGQGGSGASNGDATHLREEIAREIQQVRELIDQVRREGATQSRGGSGLTFEGQGMTLSAPGTEAFKQDFAKWQELKRQATAVLEQIESTVSKKLQDRDAKDRLAAGADDKAPPTYQEQVDSYFKALATRKKP